jgi:hypothetical protein
MVYFPRSPPSIALESKVDEAFLPALNPVWGTEYSYDFAPPGEGLLIAPDSGTAPCNTGRVPNLTAPSDFLGTAPIQFT